MRAHKPYSLAILRVKLQAEVHGGRLSGRASYRHYSVLRLLLLKPPLRAAGRLELSRRPTALLCHLTVWLMPEWGCWSLWSLPPLSSVHGPLRPRPLALQWGPWPAVWLAPGRLTVIRSRIGHTGPGACPLASTQQQWYHIARWQQARCMTGSHMWELCKTAMSAVHYAL